MVPCPVNRKLTYIHIRYIFHFLSHRSHILYIHTYIYIILPFSLAFHLYGHTSKTLSSINLLQSSTFCCSSSLNNSLHATFIFLHSYITHCFLHSRSHGGPSRRICMTSVETVLHMYKHAGIRSASFSYSRTLVHHPMHSLYTLYTQATNLYTTFLPLFFSVPLFSKYSSHTSQIAACNFFLMAARCSLTTCVGKNCHARRDISKTPTTCYTCRLYRNKNDVRGTSTEIFLSIVSDCTVLHGVIDIVLDD